MLCPNHPPPLLPCKAGATYNCLVKAQHSIMGQRPAWKELDRIAWFKLSTEATQTSITEPAIIWWTATAPGGIQPKCSRRKWLTYCCSRSSSALLMVPTTPAWKKGNWKKGNCYHPCCKRSKVGSPISGLPLLLRFSQDRKYPHKKQRNFSIAM